MKSPRNRNLRAFLPYRQSHRQQTPRKYGFEPGQCSWSDPEVRPDLKDLLSLIAFNHASFPFNIHYINMDRMKRPGCALLYGFFILAMIRTDITAGSAPVQGHYWVFKK
jgi:hypothetical protein